MTTAASGSATSGAVAWKLLAGTEDYRNLELPKGLLVLTGGSVTVLDAAGTSLTLATPGTWPIRPSRVTAATNAYALW